VKCIWFEDILSSGLGWLFFYILLISGCAALITYGRTMRSPRHWANGSKGCSNMVFFGMTLICDSER